MVPRAGGGERWKRRRHRCWRRAGRWDETRSCSKRVCGCWRWRRRPRPKIGRQRAPTAAAGVPELLHQKQRSRQIQVEYLSVPCRVHGAILGHARIPLWLPEPIVGSATNRLVHPCVQVGVGCSLHHLVGEVLDHAISRVVVVWRIRRRQLAGEADARTQLGLVTNPDVGHVGSSL